MSKKVPLWFLFRILALSVVEDVRRGGTSGVTVDGVCEMVPNRDGFCSICSCDLEFEGYVSWCLCQFTLERIDNSRGHDTETLRLSCFAFSGAEKVSRRRGCRAGRFYVPMRDV